MKNSIVKMVMDNFDEAQYFYNAFREGHICEPNSGLEFQFVNLPTDQEDRDRAAIVFAITSVQAIKTMNPHLDFPYDEFCEAVDLLGFLFGAIQLSELGLIGIHWAKTDENGLPEVSFGKVNMQKGCELFGVSYDTTNHKDVLMSLQDAIDGISKLKEGN